MSTNDVEKVRSRLHEAIAMLREIPETADARILIAEAIAYTYRTHSQYIRAARTARKVTPEIAVAVIQFKNQFPRASLQSIANKFGIGAGGRVSEILRGEWREARENYENIKEYT